MSTEVIKSGKEHKDNGDLIEIAQMYSGPLPPPEMLDGYEKSVPGSGLTIIEEFKAQGRHRRFAEKTLIIGQFSGPFIGALLAALTIFLGYSLISNGRPVTGFVMIFVPLATLVGSVIFGKKD